ncbi:MAG: cytochrome c biogenesis protein ResB [Candidatus Sumerlaeia bacterium]|nr:cytochrome c biogenesis protein ResB [Candidatus Sumerlaeia bacterium]
MIFSPRQILQGNHPVVRFFASVKLTVTLLILIGLACILGTLIPQADTLAGSPRDIYSLYVNAYGPRLHILFNILGFYRLYSSWWFSALLLLLALNMIVCSLRRFRLQARQIGFQLTHLSIVFLLAGVLIGLNAREGFIQINEGEQSDTILFVPRKPVPDTAEEAEQLTNEQRSGAARTAVELRLPFAIHLDDFELRRHTAPLDKLLVQSVHGGRIYSYGLRTQKRIPRAARQPVEIVLLDTKPLIRRTSQIVERTSGPLEPALEIEIVHDGHRHTHWVFARGTARRRILTDECEIEYVRAATPVELAALLAEQSVPTTATADCLALIRSMTDVTTLPLALGREQTVQDADGTSLAVTVLQFFPHWNMNLQTREIYSASNARRNPAIQVRLRKGDAAETQWLFSRLPSAHGRQPFDLTTMTLQFLETDMRRPHFLRAVAADTTTGRYLQHYVEGRLAATLPAAGDSPASATLPDGTQVRALRWVERSAIELIEQPDPGGFAARLRIRDLASGKVEILDAVSNEVYERGNVRFLLQRDFPVDQYISRVRVVQNGREVTSHTIEMNDPLKFAGYTVYQSSYDTEAGEASRYSVLSVKRDPGVALVYAGFVLLTAGLIIVFYINPWMQKRKHAEALAARTE